VLIKLLESLLERVPGPLPRRPSLTDAVEDSADAVERLTAEHVLALGGARHSLEDVARLAGVPADEVRHLWRAMGFADVADDARFFTGADVAALTQLRRLLDAELLDRDVVAQLARTAGRSMSRVAEAQVAALRDDAERANPPATGGELALEMVSRADRLVPVVEGLLTYSWRRHLAAALGRTLYRPGAEDGDGRALTVGFADLVGFTSLSQRLEIRELAATVDRFENAAYAVAAAHGGRVVKVIGDEVMFVADDPVAGGHIALEIPVRCEEEGLPKVRVGLAWGPALAWEGDYLGPTVNLASRLAALADPGTVLVSEAVCDELADDPAFHVQAVRARRMKGLGRVPSFVLRPSTVEAVRGGRA
jgi:adenylate cyclase